jgi:hypothetical protein
VLSGLSVSDLRDAVVNQDSGRLTKVGYRQEDGGRLFRVRDKLDAVLAAPAAREGDGGRRDQYALSLGYNDKEAAWAVTYEGLPSPTASASAQLLSNIDREQ